MPPQDLYSAGASPVVLTAGLKKSYIAVFASFVPYATPTDIITLPGNAVNTVELQRLGISSVQTTAGLNIWDLVKRAVANTGGTSANQVGVPNDSINPVAQSIPKKWTAAPTINSTVGIVAEKYIQTPTLASLLDATYWLYDNTHSDEQPLALRGVAEELALNFKGAAVPAGFAMAVILEWTEKP